MPYTVQRVFVADKHLQNEIVVTLNLMSLPIRDI